MRLSRFLVIVTISLMLVSCGGDDGNGDADKAYQRAASKRAAALRAAEASANEAKTVPSSKFVAISPGNISMLRNPFKTFLVKRVKAVKESSRILGPLECCQISTFRLLAVISSIDEPKALVLAPDGKTHTVTLGDRIGTMGGTITAINKLGIDVSVEVSDGVSDRSIIEVIKMTLDKGDHR